MSRGKRRSGGARSSRPASSAAWPGPRSPLAGARGPPPWARPPGRPVLAASEAVARARQRPGEIPALWSADRGQRRARRPAGVGGRPRLGRPLRPVAVGCGDRRPRRPAGDPPAEGAARSAARRRGGRGARSAAGGRCRPSVVAAATMAGLPGAVRAGVPGRAGQPAGRAGPGRGPAVRRAAGGPVPVRRHRLRPRAGRGARRQLRRRRARRRHRRLAGRAGRPGLRPGGGRPAGPRVLRAHHPVHPRHRAGVAAVGAARLPALPDPGRPPARPGQRADEPARDPARHPQPDRHDHARPAPTTWPRRPRLDPVVRRHRRADLRRHLHDLPARRPRATSASASRCRRPASPRRCCRGPGPAAAWS